MRMTMNRPPINNHNRNRSLRKIMIESRDFLNHITGGCGQVFPAWMWLQQNSSGVSIYQFNFLERSSRGASKFQLPLFPKIKLPLEATTWKSSAHKTTAVCRRGPVAGPSDTNKLYMDDVDRLFQCFKCGITPPQSAIRERRKEKRKLKQQFSPRQEASPSTDTQTAKKFVESRNINKQFSPIVFYGSPHAVPPKRPARLLRLLHEIRADLDEQNKLREEIWKTFPRQDEAMKFAKQHANARVFSYQDHVNGVRRFLVSRYKEFWQRYKGTSPQFRHHYEVIQEGLPCHLYFDLEFSKRENAGRNGDEMVDLLLIVIFDALLEKYSFQGNHDMVVELDSSTEEKFSRHLIIRMPKTAFKDNSHVGAFVAEICSRIYSYKERDANFQKLFVSKDSGSDSQHHPFVDTAVYSRNRCFRLYLSSKAGKKSVLLPSGRFKCKDMNDEEVFMTSLICNMDADCEKLLICKMDLDCVKELHFGTENTSNTQKLSGFPKKFDTNVCTSDASMTYLMGKSPFPALDDFVETVASHGNVSGKIRSWYWLSEYGLLVYSMSRNRYCERIGREHKSNHVIYVIDLKRAVYYQKCHDPDCRGYRSPLRPIPDDLFPDPSFTFDHARYSNDHGHTSSSGGESNTGSCEKEEWWLEVTKVADQVENLQKALDLTWVDETFEDDENWWMVAEDTASQTELAYIRQH